MKKLTICKVATLFFGFLAIGMYIPMDPVSVYIRVGHMIGDIFGLLSAIFGTQWVVYQRRQDEKSAKFSPMPWFRSLLSFAFLSLSVSIKTNAQINYYANFSNIFNMYSGQCITIVGVDADKVNTVYYISRSLFREKNQENFTK